MAFCTASLSSRSFKALAGVAVDAETFVSSAGEDGVAVQAVSVRKISKKRKITVYLHPQMRIGRKTIARVTATLGGFR